MNPSESPSDYSEKIIEDIKLLETFHLFDRSYAVQVVEAFIQARIDLGPNYYSTVDDIIHKSMMNLPDRVNVTNMDKFYNDTSSGLQSIIELLQTTFVQDPHNIVTPKRSKLNKLKDNVISNIDTKIKDIELKTQSNRNKVKADIAKVQHNMDIAKQNKDSRRSNKNNQSSKLKEFLEKQTPKPSPVGSLPGSSLPTGAALAMLIKAAMGGKTEAIATLASFGKNPNGSNK